MGPDLLTHARQARPRRRNQQGKRATGEGGIPAHFQPLCARIPFKSVAHRPGEAHHADQGGLRQLRAAVEVAQGVGP